MSSAFLQKISGDTPLTLGPRLKLVIGILLIFVILIAAYYFRSLGDIDAGLYGFWEIDSNFAEKACLDAMYIYVEPPNRRATNNIGLFGATCYMYIVIKSDGELSFNERIPVSIRRTTIFTSGTYSYDVNFGKQVACIPKCISAEYDPVASMLTFSAKKTMYARLFKRPEISYHCTVAADQEPEKEESDDAGDAQSGDTSNSDGDSNDEKSESNANQ